MRVAELKRPVPPVSPAPPFVKRYHHVGHALVLTRRRARPALRPTQWARARNRRHRNAVGGRRKRVFPVGHNAEWEAFGDVRDAEGAELELERCLRVELVVPGRVELRD